MSMLNIEKFSVFSILGLFNNLKTIENYVVQI